MQNSAKGHRKFRCWGACSQWSTPLAPKFFVKLKTPLSKEYFYFAVWVAGASWPAFEGAAKSMLRYGRRFYYCCNTIADISCLSKAKNKGNT